MLRASLRCLLLLPVPFWSAPVSAAPPVVGSVTPREVMQDVATDVTVRGTDLPASPWIALLDGGPFESGSAVLPGAAGRVASDGRLAVAALVDSGIAVFDLSDPARPRPIATVATAGRVFDLALSGTLALLAEGPAGLEIVNLADPTAPLPLASLPLNGNAVAVAAAPGRAYVADLITGLAVVDLTTPASPTLLSQVVEPWRAATVAVAGDRVYATSEGPDSSSLGEEPPSFGVAAFDVTDPAQPRWLWSRAVAGTRGVVAARADRLFLGADGDLVLADTSDPEGPAWLGRLATSAAIRAIDLQGEKALLDLRDGGWLLVDVADAMSPRALARVAGPVGGVVFARNGAVATHDGTLAFFDLAEPERPRPRTHDTFEGSVFAMAAAGDRAAAEISIFHSDRNPDGVLAFYDLEATGGPAVRSTLWRPYAQQAIAFGPSLALVGGRAGLEVIDLRDLTAPVLRALLPAPASLRSLALDASTAAAAAGEAGLLVADVANLDAPAWTGALALGGEVRHVVSAGGRFLASTGSNTLFLVEATDPAQPRVAGHVDLRGPVGGLASDGRRVLVALPDSVAVVDLDDTGDPVLRGVFTTIGMPQHVAISGTLGHVASADGPACGGALRLETYDLAEPANARLVGLRRPVAPAHALAATPDWLAVAHGGVGTSIWPVPPAPTIRVADPDTLAASVGPRLAPGPYDVVVFGGAAASAPLHNGLRVLDRCRLAVALVPRVESATRPLALASPVPVVLTVDGEDRLFDPVPRYAAVVEIPRGSELFPVLTAREPAPGRIEVDIDAGLVRLRGPEPALLSTLWEAARAAGGVALELADAHRARDVGVTLVQAGTLEAAGRLVRVRGPKTPSVTFEFAGDRLVAVRALGSDVVFRVDAADPGRCLATARASVVETLREAGGAAWRPPVRGVNQCGP